MQKESLVAPCLLRTITDPEVSQTRHRRTDTALCRAKTRPQSEPLLTQSLCTSLDSLIITSTLPHREISFLPRRLLGSTPLFEVSHCFKVRCDSSHDARTLFVRAFVRQFRSPSLRFRFCIRTACRSPSLNRVFVCE